MTRIAFLHTGAVVIPPVMELAGRAYVIPDDIKAVRYSVLRHRLVRTFDALANNVPPEQLVDAVFDAVPTP